MQNYKIKHISYDGPEFVVIHNTMIVLGAISPDSQYFVSVDLNEQIIIWRLGIEFKLFKQYQTEQSQTLMCLTFSVNSIYLALAVAEVAYVNILIYNLNSDITHPQKTLKGNKDIISQMIFTVNSQFLILNTANKQLIIWNLESESIEITYNNTYRVLDLAMSLNSKFIILQSNSECFLFNSKQIRNLKQIMTWTLQPCSSVNCFFTPDSKKLIQRSKNSIFIWSLVNSGGNLRHLRTIHSNESYISKQLSIIQNGTAIVGELNQKIQSYNIILGEMTELVKETFFCGCTQDMKYIMGYFYQQLVIHKLCEVDSDQITNC